LQHSLESRFPYLDEALVKFAINLPLKWKSKFSIKYNNKIHPYYVEKYIMKKAYHDEIPYNFLFIPKKGFPNHDQYKIDINVGFFKNGFVSNIFKMTKNDFKNIKNVKILKSKFLTIEIFGRLFQNKESRDNITEDLIRSVSDG